MKIAGRVFRIRVFHVAPWCFNGAGDEDRRKGGAPTALEHRGRGASTEPAMKIAGRQSSSYPGTRQRMALQRSRR